jgi:hypothetical protein
MANKKNLARTLKTFIFLFTFIFLTFLVSSKAQAQSSQFSISNDETTVYLKFSGLDSTKRYSLYIEGTYLMWAQTNDYGPSLNFSICRSDVNPPYYVETLNGTPNNNPGFPTPCRLVWEIGNKYNYSLKTGTLSTVILEDSFTIPSLGGSLQFSVDPSYIAGETTIKRLDIWGGSIQPNWSYSLQLNQAGNGWSGGNIGKQSGSDNNCSDAIPDPADKNWWKANSQGHIIVENICENGHACKNSCGTAFSQDKTYEVQVYETNPKKYVGSVLLQSGLTKGPGGLTPGHCGPKNNGVPTALGCIDTDTAGFINAFSLVAFGLGFGIAFLMMVFGTIKILTSSGNPEGVNSGREIIISALTGLLFMIFGVFLLRLIGGNIFHFPIPGT